jgi:hypothetical protein
MTYIIIKEKTYINGSKLFSVHDRGYNLASDEDTRFVSCYIDNVIQDPIKVAKDKNFNFNQVDYKLPFPEVEQCKE